MRQVRRWGLLVLIAVGVHVGLLWWLEGPLPRAPQEASFGSSIHLVDDSWSAERLANLPGMHDPAVFALPSVNGFSRAGWLSFRPLQHEFSDTQIAPQWLEVPVQELGNVFKDFFASNSVAPMRIADEALPPLIGSTPRESSDLPLPASELRVSGAVGGRPILNPAALPSWAHTDILTNTVVQAVVDADGNVVSCAMLFGCGLKEADAYGLKLARSLRFKPLRIGAKERGDAVASGKLTFMWQTLAPTSAPPATAAAVLTR